MRLRRLLLHSRAFNRPIHPVIRPRWAPRTAVPTYRRQFHSLPALSEPRKINAKLRDEKDGVRVYDETEDGPTEFKPEANFEEDVEITPADEARIQAWQQEFGISDEMLAYLVTRYPGIEQQHIEDIKTGKLKESQLPKLLYPDGNVPKSVPEFKDLGEGVTEEERELAKQMVEGDGSSEDLSARALAKAMAEDERLEQMFLKGLSPDERKEFEEMRNDPELRELLKGLNQMEQEDEEDDGDIQDEDEGGDGEGGQGGDGEAKAVRQPKKSKKAELLPRSMTEEMEKLIKELGGHPDMKGLTKTLKELKNIEDNAEDDDDPETKELKQMIEDLERAKTNPDEAEAAEQLQKLVKFEQTNDLPSTEGLEGKDYIKELAAQAGLDTEEVDSALHDRDSDYDEVMQEQEESTRQMRDEERDVFAKFNKIREKPGFWNYDDPGAGEDEVFQGDDLSSMGHGELEQHREIREYARYAAWEMPLLSKLAKPFELPPDTQPLRFRYTTYFGEDHPAGRKVVLKFAPKDLQKLADLTDEQVTKMIKLCGVRYNPETELVKISSDRFETQAQNKRYLGDLVDKLIVEAKNSKDMFEDVPLDTRHHKKKPWYQFPEKWLLTEERRKELEEKRKMSLEQEEMRELEGNVVDGLGVIARALKGGRDEVTPVMVGAGARRGRLL